MTGAPSSSGDSLPAAVREAFEKWINSPPYEKSIKRFASDESWPESYLSYEVHLAWDAWQAALRHGAELGVRAEREIAEVRRKLQESNRECRNLRLILRGMSDEHFHLKVTISPEIFNANIVDAIQVMLQQYAGQTAYAIEQKMGAPLEHLREALLHIYYLEAHASSQGLPFKAFSWKADDRPLMDFYP